MIFLISILLLNVYVEPAVNPHLNALVDGIRCINLQNADNQWDLYIKSLVEEHKFSERTQQLGGLTNIKKQEIAFVEKKISEAEFSYQIGIDFANDAMSMESEWFLNKAESLGYVDVNTYWARAHNYAEEWNDILHYNEDLSDPELEIYEKKWRENLLHLITNTEDNIDVASARLALTTIYAPFRTPIYISHFAPEVIINLEKFIKNYPQSPLIDQAYERLVWWLYTTKQHNKLAEVCRKFLQNYLDSPIKEYITAQLGNAYYFSGNFEEAKMTYSSIKRDSFPDFVYPGWGGNYILNDIETRLDSINTK